MADTRTPAELAQWDQTEAFLGEQFSALVDSARTALGITTRDQVASHLGTALGENVEPAVLGKVLAVAVLRLAEAPPAATGVGEPDA